MLPEKAILQCLEMLKNAEHSAEYLKALQILSNANTKKWYARLGDAEQF